MGRSLGWIWGGYEEVIEEDISECIEEDIGEVVREVLREVNRNVIEGVIGRLLGNLFWILMSKMLGGFWEVVGLFIGEDVVAIFGNIVAGCYCGGY